MAKAPVRDRIVSEGLEAVFRDGFNATGVQDIADAAGVPKGSFYNYFRSKEALGVEIVDLYFSGVKARFNLLSDPSKPPLDRLRGYFASLGQVLIKGKYGKGCLVGNLSGELSDQSPAVRKRLASVYKEWSRALEGCIREGQERGEIARDVNASVLASFLLTAWEGTILRAKVEKEKAALNQFMMVAFKRLLN
jgi:TetR/AcrR family transcriptional regulator, transcriptional repressor for nem operon